MTLHLGKMTNTELADFFEVEKAQFDKRKKRFMKKLQSYCDFKEFRGGVEIIHIIEESYCGITRKDYVENNFDSNWRESGDTVSRVARKLCDEQPNGLGMKQETSRKYTAQARDKRWGSPKKQNGGARGKCKFEYAKVYYTDDKDVQFFKKLDEEDNKIFEKLKSKYFPVKVDKEDTDRDRILKAEDLIMNHEWSKEEAYDYVKENNGINSTLYHLMMVDLAHELNCDKVQLVTVSYKDTMKF